MMRLQLESTFKCTFGDFCECFAELNVWRSFLFPPSDDIAVARNQISGMTAASALLNRGRSSITNPGGEKIGDYRFLANCAPPAKSFPG
jgi:hypothetical protein